MYKGATIPFKTIWIVLKYYRYSLHTSLDINFGVSRKFRDLTSLGGTRPSGVNSFFIIHFKIACNKTIFHMDSSHPARKFFESEPGGACRRQGRPRQRWVHKYS